MSLVITELNNLGLECLENGWVQAIYHSEFLEFGDLPLEYESFVESISLRSTFKDIIKAIEVWLSSKTESSEEKSWASLSHQLEHDKVLALLAYYIDNGCKNVLTKEHRNMALLASRVYYKLLSIPGYKAYHIYHSQLFAQSLACLGFPKGMCDNENNYFNSKELTHEVNSVIRELKPFVVDLRAITEHLQLSPSDMNFEDILSNLVDITGGAIVNKLHVDKIELNNLSGEIYEIINTLICNADGNPNPIAIRLLFKCLLPKLVAASVDTRNANNIVRASYVTYSGLLLSKYGKAALYGYMLLLQHLCFSQDGLERQDVRSARVNLVLGLMSLLPRKSYRKTVKWILQLSTTSRVSHRQIAMELLAKLLNNDPEEPNLGRPIPEINNETSTINDSGISSEQSSDATTDLTGDQTTQENISVQRIDAEDESSQDSLLIQVDNDDAMEGILQQRAQTVPHAALVRGVYERVADAAGTVRTRALAILTDCVASTRAPIVQAIQELNGTGEVSRLMAVGARSVCDERAAVRRAGVALVRALLSAPGPPRPTDLAVLVNLCRDASIIVRSAAMAALGDMATMQPSEPVIDAFLSGPMHQLSDPETKLQEQVVSLVQQLLIDRLQVYSGPDGEEDPVPWLILAGIVKRKMKRHLQKACAMITKNGNNINHRILDILSTHLGVMDDARDLQCLVLLCSIARHVEYSNVGFVINYYYKLTENEESRDVRLMSLALELTSAWSRYVQGCERTALRDHLVRRLATAGADGCRIACATLAARLDPANLTWATELMQLSERRAVPCEDIVEGVRAADLSLVAPEPPTPELLKLFLRALKNPPKSWSDAMYGSCVAGTGRLCVRSRDAAVVAAPSLAALLPAARAPLQARVNALLALTDICVRYTSIVDPLLGSVSGCLSTDSPPELRRATVRALTRLLLGGFLRLRTPLYFEYCALLADEDHDVREPAEYYVTSCLTTDTIYHHLVDCIIYYNRDSSGSVSFDARQLIYDVMLQRLSMVQKLNVQCRLARDVLEHAADLAEEGDELPPALNAALLDAITLLCGPRMKLPAKKPQNDADEAHAEELQERVTTNLVSHKMKRTVAEVLVPAVLRLYTSLQSRGGQLVAYLVRIATNLLSDYREEIEEINEFDDDLLRRIRHFEETIGLPPSFGNARNLVTSSAPPEPDTPRAPRRRPHPSRPAGHSPRKRALRI